MPACPARWRDYPPWPDRLLERIIVLESDCWILDHRGDRGSAPSVRQIVSPPPGTGIAPGHAYKIVYEFLHGPLPPGVELFCGCGNQHCVKPGHRILLTRREIQRINVWRQFGYDTERQCRQGHPRSEFGLRTATNGRLRCRACDNARRRQHRADNPEMNQLADRKRKRRKAGWPTGA